MDRTYKLAERLLSVENLNLQYGDKIVLRDVNISVDNIVRPGMQQGQTIALLGPSGIGKTQLFRCLAGLQRPTSGIVRIKDEKEPVTAGDIGVVQQNYPLLQHRTIMGNLKLVCKDEKKINDYLTRFGLGEHVGKYPVQLSGGQRQRIAIIQQMIAARHFLLMDEPFSGLDIIAKDKVIKLINEVSIFDEHNTTICTTHDLESAVQIADVIWIMGREEGKPGATIVKTMDLIVRGLAWNEDAANHPNFHSTVDELKAIFKTL